MLVLARILGFGVGLAGDETEWEKGRFKMGRHASRVKGNLGARQPLKSVFCRRLLNFAGKLKME